MADPICYLRQGGAASYLPTSSASISVEDRAFLFSDALYEVVKALRTAGTLHLFLEADHWDRLCSGCRALSLELPHTRAELGHVARELLRLNGLCQAEGEQALVYLQVSRGSAPRAHATPLPAGPATVYAYAKAYAPPAPEALARGAAAVLCADARWGGCGTKTTSLLPNVLANTAARDAGAYEALLLRPRPGHAPAQPAALGASPVPQLGQPGGPLYAAEALCVAECSHSNVFAVVRDGQRHALITHPLDNVLPGITRKAILQRFSASPHAAACAAQLGGALEVREEPWTLADVLSGRVREVIVTSTGVNAMPCTRVLLAAPSAPASALVPSAALPTIKDGVLQLGEGGAPGPVARALIAAFHAWTAEDAAAAAAAEAAVGQGPTPPLPEPASAASLSAAQWAAYDRDGFLVLDCAASGAEVAALNARLDDIMLGRVQYGEKLVMQLDPNSLMGGSSSSAAAGASPGAALGAAAGAGGGEESLARAAYAALGTEFQTAGFKGASLAYRKVGEAQAGLECDPIFLAYMRKPLFAGICARVYGAHAPVAVYRAMVMSKPAGDLGGGTPLPWHQDGGNWWALDRDPLCFVWLALTPATAENGAVELVRGSHRRGILSQRGHTLSPEHVAQLVDAAPEADRVKVVLKPGQAFLCHNWTIHRSGVNVTGTARRGFSCVLWGWRRRLGAAAPLAFAHRCHAHVTFPSPPLPCRVNYIDARTRVLSPKPADSGDLGRPGEGFPLIFPATYSA